MYFIVKKVLDENKLSINRDMALEYFGGNNDVSIEIYNDFLKLYYDNYHNLDLILTNKLINEDFNQIIDIIHKIKGLAIYTGCELFYNYVVNIYEKYLLHNFDDIFDEINLLIALNKKIIEMIER